MAHQSNSLAYRYYQEALRATSQRELEGHLFLSAVVSYNGEDNLPVGCRRSLENWIKTAPGGSSEEEKAMLLQVRTALVEDWRGIARAFGYSTIETANGKITNVREGAPAKKRLVEMRIANQNDDDPQGEDKGKGPANVSNTSKPTKKRKAGSSSKGQPASKKKATVEKAKVSKAVEGNKTSTTAPSTEQRPEESEAPANHAMSTGLKLPESGAQSESNNQQNGEISLTTQMAAPTIDEEHPEKLFGVIAGTHDGAGVVFYDAAKDEVDSEDDEHGAAQAGMDF